MPARSKMGGNRTVGGEQPLRRPCGLEPVPAPLPLAAGLVCVFGTVVEVPMLAVLHPRETLWLRRGIALQRVGDDHLWDVSSPFEQRTAKLLRRLRRATAWDAEIEPLTVLIHRSPEGMAFTVDGRTPFIQGPLVAWAEAPPA